ncbi:ribbon-helix-helix protein, CopG family [Patescibacteria group bacterium]|nr:ribbon-helix-helix protein, CopG family [Patescibacteria group bacterium]
MDRQVVSISLYKKYLRKLDKMSKRQNKSRSQIVRDLLDKYETDKEWEQVYAWGRETAKKFNIKSEEDVLRIIND